MYTPPYFALKDAAKIAEFLRDNSFGVLTSLSDGALCATHLPFLYDAEQNALFAHMARANPAWRDLPGQSALVVFSGPHAYVSPSWYGERESVPTWNYAAVHVSGTCSLLEDGAELAVLLQRTVRFYEPGSTLLSQADEPFYRKMMQGIVGFRVDIARIEGKAKLSQNKSGVVRGRVLEQLAKSNDAGARGVARLMQEEADLEGRSLDESGLAGHGGDAAGPDGRGAEVHGSERAPGAALGRAYLDCALENFRNMKRTGERAMGQLSFAQLQFAPNAESNSVARIVRHMAGNMMSRWTDFLTSDGEKPTRDRDGEFAGAFPSREALLAAWKAGWEQLFRAIEPLTDEDLLRTVYIRTEPHTVIRAVERQVAHLSLHVGQIVYLAKQIRAGEWETLSIARGASREYLETMAQRHAKGEGGMPADST